MQIRAGKSYSWLAAAVLLLGSVAVVSTGCGGGSSPSATIEGGNNGGGGGGGETRFATFRVKVDWGPRTRVVGLSSALSARITMAGADSNAEDITWVVNRPDGQAGVSIPVVYDTPRQAKVGSHLLTVKFYGTPDATGPEVGFAQASATVVTDGSLTVTISTYTGIQTVAVVPNQSVEVGETKDLTFEARNSKGELVPLTHGSALFAVSANPANLETIDNGSSVRGKRPIEAFVTVKVDGAISKAERVAVTSRTELSVSPIDAAIGSEFPLDLNASIVNAPETEVTFAIKGGSGTANGTLESVTGNSATYVAPKVTGDTVKTVEILVVSKYDSTKRTTVPVTVNAPATVTVTPAAPTISFDESVSLAAVVNNLSPRIPAGDARRGVTWKVLTDGSGQSVGKVSKDGIYTAPKREGTFTVVATSVYDPTKSVEVPVTVESAVAVTVDPNPAPVLEWEQALNLTAAVARTTVQNVTWTVVSPAGFSGALVSTGPSTARFTAPKRNGTYLVRATSVFDTRRSFTLSIDVQTNVVVKVTPEVVKMSVKATKQFSVAVTGLPAGKDATVTWTVTGPNGEANAGNKYGTISGSGLFTAPATVAKNGLGKLEQVSRIVATSNYDPASSSAATVTVVGGSIGVDVN